MVADFLFRARMDCILGEAPCCPEKLPSDPSPPGVQIELLMIAEAKGRGDLP